MSRHYYNKGNKYNKGYYNGNDWYDYNSNKNYNNYGGGGGGNNYYKNYDNDNRRNNNYYTNNNKKNNNYDRYNYNGINTKYKEKRSNYQNNDYFEKKFNQEINNDVFDDTKIIISSCLQEKNINENEINNNDDEVIIYENKSFKGKDSNNENVENEEKGLIDEYYNKYMGVYEKQIEIDQMEKYCKEVNERELNKGELNFKDEFQKNKKNNGVFNPRDYEIFKVVHGNDKKGNSTKIIDFSFNKKGIEENNLYLNNPEYFSYFRRGFSLYELNDKLIILRKGLIKFNELPYDFYKIYGKNKYELYFDYKDSEENNLEQRTNFQELLKSIFYPIYKYLAKKNKITLYKLLKANGENAQIGYNQQLQKWVIASKNVSLICKGRVDLYDNYEPLHKNSYKPTRYNIAFQIALCWFDILENKEEEEINEIIKYMNNRTFCGEYCGNQYHEHLIRHTKHTIYFYSIVDNNDKNNICLPIEETFDIFKKLNLEHVNYAYVGTYKNKNELFEGIQKVYKLIAEKSILYEEEGDVLYFVNDTDKKVISLCKVKTLEYKIYRKLREKIKNELNNEDHEFNMNRKKISQFFNEVQALSQSFKLPNSLEFYFTVSDMAFRFIDFYKKKFVGDNPEFDLHTSYLDLIEMIHSIIDDNFNLKSKNNILTTQEMINNLYQIKKNIQIFLFAPPYYIPDDYLNHIKKKFNIHFKYKFISFNNNDNNIINLNSNKNNENNIEIVLINYLDPNCFDKINKELYDNQYIIAFGINSKQFENAKEKFIEKLNNPDFFIYNKNSGLFTYFKNKNNENNINDLFKNFLSQCYKILFEMKKKYPNKVKIYDTFNEEENNKNTYSNDLENIINEIKKIINNTDYEKKIIKEIEDYINNGSKQKNETQNKEVMDIKEEKDNKESSIISKDDKNKNKIESDFISGALSKNKNEPSKYYNSNIISLYQEHENVYTPLLPKFLEYEESQIKAKLEAKKNNTNNSSSSKIIIIIPITLPGSGKTELITYLKNSTSKYGIYFDYISSDDIRKKEIEIYMEKIPGMTEREAFNRSRNYYNKSFQEAIENKFKSLYLNNKLKNCLLFIDKNHPPNAINKTIEPIKKIISNFTNIDKQVSFVALIPECINNFIFGTNLSLPFSLSYLIQCYIRVRNRKNHPLMNQNRKDLLLFLMGSFIKNFIGFSLDSSKLMDLYSIDQTFKIQFTDELDDSQFPEDIMVPSMFFIGTLVDSKYDSTVTTSDSENFENKINKYFFNIDTKIPFNSKDEIRFKVKKNIFYPTRELISCKIELMIQHFFPNVKDNNYFKNDENNNKDNNLIEIKLKNFIYIAIIFRGDSTCFKIKPKVYKTLRAILQKFPNFYSEEEKNEIKDLASSIQIIKSMDLPKGWTFPHKMRGNYWHITTLYRGNKSFEEVEKSLAYQQYVEDKKVFVTVIGLVYVPEGIMCLLIKLNDGIICSGNYPHMTIMRNKYPPKYSNTVIKECMKIKEMKYKYDKKLTGEKEEADNEINTNNENKGDFIIRKQIKIDESSVLVYFVLFEKTFDVQGIMHAFERDDNNNIEE